MISDTSRKPGGRDKSTHHRDFAVPVQLNNSSESEKDSEVADYHDPKRGDVESGDETGFRIESQSSRSTRKGKRTSSHEPGSIVWSASENVASNSIGSVEGEGTLCSSEDGRSEECDERNEEPAERAGNRAQENDEVSSVGG